MAELITFGETPLRFSPPGNQRLEMAQTMNIYADGTASNVAVTAEKLGAETLWLSKLPQTPLGRRVKTRLEAQEIDTAVTWSDDPAHRQGLTFCESAVYPRESNSWHDRGNTAVGTVTPSDLPMDRVQETEIIFTGLGTAVLSQQATETTGALLGAAGGSGAMTAVALDYSRGLAPPETYRGVLGNLSESVDLFFARETTARDALDHNGGPRELANTIAAEYDLDMIVIKCIDRGGVALRDSPGTNIIHEREPLETEDIDPTGQFGGFIGAFLQQLIEGGDTARSLTHAVAAASLARTIPGPFLTTTVGELEPLVERAADNSR